MASHISLVALARVRDITLPDPNKPKSYTVHCDFKLEKEKHLLTIPVSMFFSRADDIPINGTYVWITGAFWMPPKGDDIIEAESFKLLEVEPSFELPMPAPCVNALGTVVCVIGRNIYMEVSAYNRQARAVWTYQIQVIVPDNNRRANMQMPESGTRIAITGTLAEISVHENFDDILVPSIDLENITYLPRDKARTEYPKKSQPSTGGKNKRQLAAEKAGKAVDTGRPMKKSKSGPVEAFTAEELGAANPSQSGSSQDSTSYATDNGASESSTGMHPSSVDGSPPSSVKSTPPSSVENTPVTTGRTRAAVIAAKGAKGKGSIA